MATWTITSDMRVTWRARGQEAKSLGKAKTALLEEVLQWIVLEAKPWDIVACPQGLFVRQSAPNVN